MRNFQNLFHLANPIHLVIGELTVVQQDVRDYAAKLNMTPEDALEKGMADKSTEFRVSGAEVYRKI